MVFIFTHTAHVDASPRLLKNPLQRTSSMTNESTRDSYCCCSHRVLCCATGNELMIGVITKDGFVSSRDIHEWVSTDCNYSHILMLFAGKDSIVGLQVVSKGRNKRRSSILWLQSIIWCIVLPFTMHRLIAVRHLRFQKRDGYFSTDVQQRISNTKYGTVTRIAK